MTPTSEQANVITHCANGPHPLTPGHSHTLYGIDTPEGRVFVCCGCWDFAVKGHAPTKPSSSKNSDFTERH